MRHLNGRDIESNVTADLLSGSVARATVFSYIFSAATLIFGFLSYGYLHDIDPQITLFGNLWPRLIVSSGPFFLLALFMKNVKVAADKKLLLWAGLQGVLYSATSMIHVWPLAVDGHSEVLFRVNGINLEYAIAAMLVVCVPRNLLVRWSVIFSLTLLVPIVLVSYLSRDSLVFAIVANDIFNGLLAGTVCAHFIGKVYERNAVLEANRTAEAAKYLGEEVHSAIFEGKAEAITEKTIRGFVLSFDIRESSKLTHDLGERWSSFISEWVARAPEVIDAFQGHLIKTAGDSLLIVFDGSEQDVDLTDLPHLGRDVADADEQRWNGLSHQVMRCADQLAAQFLKLGEAFFPERKVRFGMGVDRGRIRRGVRGSDLRKELDIWGDPVNCASRLEAFTKVLQMHFEKGSSFFVMSPYAADYISDFDGFIKFETQSKIKDFPGIRWVLVREYREDFARS